MKFNIDEDTLKAVEEFKKLDDGRNYDFQGNFIDIENVDVKVSLKINPIIKALNQKMKGMRDELWQATLEQANESEDIFNSAQLNAGRKGAYWNNKTYLTARSFRVVLLGSQRANVMGLKFMYDKHQYSEEGKHFYAPYVEARFGGLQTFSEEQMSWYESRIVALFGG